MIKKSNQENFRNYKNEELTDIITSVPSWIIRWGISIIILVVLMILLVSNIIKYPEMIKADLVISNVEISTTVAGKSNYIGELQISQNDIRKIKLGQKVSGSLKSFPYQEYGLIQGKIYELLPNLSQNKMFVAKVRFDSLTEKNSKITLKKGLLGSADIIISEITLMQKLFANLKKTKIIKPLSK